MIDLPKHSMRCGYGSIVHRAFFTGVSPRMYRLFHKCYDKNMNRTPLAKGKRPKDRKLQTAPKPGKKLTANQWSNTPQQNLFMEYWMTPSSETFSNAYRSAIRADYSPHYANQITSAAQNWIKEYMRLNIMNAEHVQQGIQNLALKANNSRSPDDTRLKAYELLGKATGLLTDTKQVTNIIVQPILGGQSVPPKQVIEVDPPIQLTE